MPAPADRNLLFGAIALQLRLISRDALTAAMNVRLIESSKSLREVLEEEGQLSTDEAQHVDALADALLKRHGSDPQQSLTVLSMFDPATAKQIRGLIEPDLGTLVNTAESNPGEGMAIGSRRSPGSSRFEIVRPHAKGGLGEVFLAQDTELKRSVALKEIQPQYADDADSRSRFVLEAEITGGLEHPGVVPVYGLGAYADGRPFYAMRFIQGDNLKQAIKRFHVSHAEPEALATVRSKNTVANASGSVSGSVRFDTLEFRQLLRRLIDVCNAIAYAHSRGVLHRDLKPGNVMLGQYGETLVVDWGLAKVLNAATPTAKEPKPKPANSALSSQSSDLTQVGQALGTPAYMSPEQAIGNLELLGPWSDIYSLGATLFEILTGRVAFPEVDIEAIVTGRFPPPRQLLPAVPQALDAICRKAMALRPKDRYASAQELAADLERWLADEPVTAWREPWDVRARRWIRRHTRLVTGIAATLVVGLAGFAMIAFERERAREAVAAEQARTAAQRDRANEERDEKEAERRKTSAERDRAVAARKQTREALDAMISAATGDSLTTQKALSDEQKAFLQNVLTYYEGFAAEPGEDLEARIRLANAHYRLGLIRYRLGQIEPGVPVLRRAAELFGQLAAEHPTEPEFRSRQARSYNVLGLMLKDLGQREQAEAAYRSALPVQNALARDHPTNPRYRSQLATTHNNLGMLLRSLGKPAEAESEFRSAISQVERLAADNPTEPDYRSMLAANHVNLGALLATSGRRTEAETTYRSALDLRLKLAADFPTVPEYQRGAGTSHNNLGALLVELGKRAEAEAAYRAALVIREKLAADFPGVPDYRRELAVSHNNLGTLLQGDPKRQADALAAHRAALMLRERLAAEFPDIPDDRSQLASCYASIGLLLRNDPSKLAEALAAFRTAAKIRAQLVADFPTVTEFQHEYAVGQSGLAQLLKGLGQLSEAEAAYRAALAFREKLAAEPGATRELRQELAGNYNNLGVLLSDLKRKPEAEAAMRSALGCWQKLVGDSPRDADSRIGLATSYGNLGQLLSDLGKLAEAESTYRAGIAVREKLVADYPANPSYQFDLASQQSILGMLLRTMGRRPEAEAASRAALDIRERLVREFPAMPEYRSGLAASYRNLAVLFREQGRNDEAVAAYRSALAIEEKLVADFPSVSIYRQRALGTQASLGLLLARSGRPGEATALADKLAADHAATGGMLYTCACINALSRDEERADRALALLRQAAVAGYRDLPRLLADEELNSLRLRDGFAAILWDLTDLPSQQTAK